MQQIQQFNSEIIAKRLIKQCEFSIQMEKIFEANLHYMFTKTCLMYDLNRIMDMHFSPARFLVCFGNLIMAFIKPSAIEISIYYTKALECVINYDQIISKFKMMDDIILNDHKNIIIEKMELLFKRIIDALTKNVDPANINISQKIIQLMIKDVWILFGAFENISILIRIWSEQQNLQIDDVKPHLQMKTFVDKLTSDEKKELFMLLVNDAIAMKSDH